MKRKVLVLFVMSALCLLNGYGQQKKNGFTINGTLLGKDTGIVYLVNTETEQTDSVALKNGRFIFKGQVSSPSLFVLRFSALQAQSALFVENAVITYTAHIDSLNKGVVKGSVTDAEYRQYGKEWDTVYRRAGVLYRRLDSLNKATNNKPDAESRAAIDRGFRDLDTFSQQIQDHFIRQHAGSPVAAFVIDARYVTYNYFDKVKEMYAVLTPAAKKSFYGQKVNKAMETAAKTAIGATPAFAQADTSGKVVRLADFRGKYVLVDFWASWCVPCRKENPNVVAAYQKYHDKGFDIIGVSLDSKKDPWLKAIHADQLTWTHISDLQGWKNELVLQYGITVVPTNFLLDKEGKIIAKNLRGEALEKKLQELLGS